MAARAIGHIKEVASFDVAAAPALVMCVRVERFVVVDSFFGVLFSVCCLDELIKICLCGYTYSKYLLQIELDFEEL